MRNAAYLLQQIKRQGMTPTGAKRKMLHNPTALGAVFIGAW